MRETPNLLADTGFRLSTLERERQTLAGQVRDREKYITKLGGYLESSHGIIMDQARERRNYQALEVRQIKRNMRQENHLRYGYGGLYAIQRHAEAAQKINDKEGDNKDKLGKILRWIAQTANKKADALYQATLDSEDSDE